MEKGEEEKLKKDLGKLIDTYMPGLGDYRSRVVEELYRTFRDHYNFVKRQPEPWSGFEEDSWIVGRKPEKRKSTEEISAEKTKEELIWGTGCPFLIGDDTCY